MREEECVQEEDMGLIDVINGVLAGPRGQGQPQQPGAAQGGMSPITMAVLGVLAYKALKGSGILGGAQPAAGGGTAGGGLGDLLSGGLGSLLGGGSGGSMLTSGLSTLVSDLQNAGQARAAQSWVGSGPNQPIAPNALSAALGEDTIQALTQQTGMPRENLLAALSQHLPEVVNQLTPAGRLPTESEAAELLDTATAGGAAGKSQAS
jgi:uncharacterized protein YidB (DUF937 family)